VEIDPEGGQGPARILQPMEEEEEEEEEVGTTASSQKVFGSDGRRLH
jgi:hypothetical protein